MINSRDSFSEYNLNAVKTYEVPYRVGEVLEKKNDSNALAMISEIRITPNGMSFVLGFDRNTYDFVDVEIVTKEELIENWKKLDPTKIIIWCKIKKLDMDLGLVERTDKEYDRFEATEKGILLVKRK